MSRFRRCSISGPAWRKTILGDSAPWHRIVENGIPATARLVRAWVENEYVEPTIHLVFEDESFEDIEGLIPMIHPVFRSINAPEEFRCMIACHTAAVYLPGAEVESVVDHLPNLMRELATSCNLVAIKSILDKMQRCDPPREMEHNL